jgi:hypothetical protein
MRGRLIVPGGWHALAVIALVSLAALLLVACTTTDMPRDTALGITELLKMQVTRP